MHRKMQFISVMHIRNFNVITPVFRNPSNFLLKNIFCLSSMLKTAVLLNIFVDSLMDRKLKTEFYLK